jgi:hypothetical protein
MTFGWYGLGRMFIEGLRMDSLYSEIFGLEFRTSQVLAGAIFIVCLALYIYFLIKKPNKPFFCKAPALAEEGLKEVPSEEIASNEVAEEKIDSSLEAEAANESTLESGDNQTVDEASGEKTEA